MEWILFALILLVIILLIKIIRDLRKLHAAGAHSGGTPVTKAGLDGLNDALAILNQLVKEDRKPTQAECKQLKDHYDAAVAGHVSGLQLEPVRNLLSTMCP